MRFPVLWAVCGAVWGVAAVGCSDTVDCDEENASFHTSVASARSGDVIELDGRCDYTWDIETFPAGVTLRGNGAVMIGTRIGNPPVVGGEDERPTRLESLRFRGEGIVLLILGGQTELVDVSVTANRGFAVVVEAASLSMVDCDLRGSLLTEVQLSELGDTIDPNEVSVAGLIATRTTLDIQNTSVARFAGFGAVLHECDGRWRGGRLDENVGTSLLVEGSRDAVLSLEGLVVERALRAPNAGELGFANGVVISSRASVETSNVQICGVDGIGLLQDQATSDHNNIVIEDNEGAGVWVQNSVGAQGESALKISGSGSRIDGNLGMGVYARAIDGLEIADASITNTREALFPALGGVVPQPVGEGLQLSEVSGLVNVRNTAFTNNRRVGVLVDGLGSEDLALNFEGVRIEADVMEEGTLGALFQNLGDVDRSGIAVEPAALAQRDEDAAERGEVRAIAAPLGAIAGIAAVIQGGVVGDGGLVGDDGGLNDVVVDVQGRLVPGAR